MASDKVQWSEIFLHIYADYHMQFSNAGQSRLHCKIAKLKHFLFIMFWHNLLCKVMFSKYYSLNLSCVFTNRFDQPKVFPSTLSRSYSIWVSLVIMLVSVLLVAPAVEKNNERGVSTGAKMDAIGHTGNLGHLKNSKYLTHLPLVPHICASDSGQHWFR